MGVFKKNHRKIILLLARDYKWDCHIKKKECCKKEYLKFLLALSFTGLCEDVYLQHRLGANITV